jgi:IclR family acetate operon transcriptional repressor
MGENVKINAVKNTTDLLYIVSQKEIIGVSEAARELDMPNSTVHDYLRSLEEMGYLKKTDEGYSLTTRLLEMGARHRLQMEIYTTAGEEIKKIARETGEHASLMIEEDGLGIFLTTVMGEHAVGVAAHDGTRTPLHATAPGRTILAHLPDDRVDEIIDQRGLPSLTQKTITDRAELQSELESIRDRGYASEEGETLDGIRGVAAPILERNANKILGAISVYAPTSRTKQDNFEETVQDLLIESANIIELNLTYS